MHITHITYWDLAFAYRLHKMMRKYNMDSHMIVAIKSSGDNSVYQIKGKITRIKYLWNSRTEQWIQHFTGGYPSGPWSSNLFGVDLLPKQMADADILNLHWIGSNLLPIRLLNKLNKPIVWTTMDSWPYTGGCHVLGECTRFQSECRDCPQLGEHQRIDLARRIFKNKQKYYPPNMTIIGKSRWAVEMLKKSALLGGFDIRLIHNGIDLSIYKPQNKMFCRELLGLPPDAKIILFGAISATTNPNKGFQYLCEALRIVSANYPDKENMRLVVFGADCPQEPPDFGFETIYTGVLRDNLTLNVLYSAADVMVVPSKQETFGNTALEAIACGTPCVAFNATGLKDIIVHKECGYLAEPYDSQDLANGIAYVLADAEHWKQLSIAARKQACQKFDIQETVKVYKSLYEELLLREN